MMRKRGTAPDRRLRWLKTTIPLLASVIHAAGVAGLHGQSTGSALFASHDLLDLVLTADFVGLKADRGLETEYRPAVLTVITGEGLSRPIEIRVKTRGRFRLANCLFPPLRIKFPGGSAVGTTFEGEEELKLVCHCREGDGEEQDVLEEYLAYRTYNTLTDKSFRVRLARITYIDTRGAEDPITRYAFFIEHKDSVAQRLDAVAVNESGVDPANLNADAAARMALFQFMVGNIDWDVRRAHNVELLRTKEGPYIPVPYDFDFAGIVAPGYAWAEEDLDPRTRPDRAYRGFCHPGADFSALYSDFLELRPEIEEVYRELEGLQEDNRRAALEYLDGFFSILSVESRARTSIEEKCEGA